MRGIYSTVDENIGGRPIVITTGSAETIGVEIASFGNTGTASPAWLGGASANGATFIPLHITESMTVMKMMVTNGATTGGNFDLGIYNESGTKLVSIGSTVQTGSNSVQEVNITDTLLVPGRYYIAMAADTTIGTYLSFTVNQINQRHFGCAQMAAAFPLPSTATLAASTTGYVPVISIYGRTLAA